MARYEGPLDIAYKLLEKERDAKQYKCVRLLTGKYEGREGVCKGVTVSETYDKRLCFTYCIYVLRADAESTFDVLNTDGESRAFRPQEEFEWI